LGVLLIKFLWPPGGELTKTTGYKYPLRELIFKRPLPEKKITIRKLRKKQNEKKPWRRGAGTADKGNTTSPTKARPGKSGVSLLRQQKNKTTRLEKTRWEKAGP